MRREGLPLSIEDQRQSVREQRTIDAGSEVGRPFALYQGVSAYHWRLAARTCLELHKDTAASERATAIAEELEAIDRAMDRSDKIPEEIRMRPEGQKRREAFNPDERFRQD